MKTPILIVCFRRPENLRTLVQYCITYEREVYIFVDGSDIPDQLNDEVIYSAKKYAEEYSSIHVHVSDMNLGVGKAVPVAIDWILSLRESTIVLEDDCIPNQFALDFFDSNIKRINGKIVMICGSSLPSLPPHLEGKLYLSKYPLIWGWAVNRASWSIISPTKRIVAMDVLKKILLQPTKILPIMFFYAAYIKIQRNILHAWDVPIALIMLMNNYASIAPDHSVITNIGADDVASHEMIPGVAGNVIVSHAAQIKPGTTLQDNKKKIEEFNSRIVKEVYRMKKRQIFSPIKSMIVVKK